MKLKRLVENHECCICFIAVCGQTRERQSTLDKHKLNNFKLLLLKKHQTEPDWMQITHPGRLDSEQKFRRCWDIKASEILAG